jgi:hypothetical protein
LYSDPASGRSRASSSCTDRQPWHHTTTKEQRRRHVRRCGRRSAAWRTTRRPAARRPGTRRRLWPRAHPPHPASAAGPSSPIPEHHVRKQTHREKERQACFVFAVLARAGDQTGDGRPVGLKDRRVVCGPCQLLGALPHHHNRNQRNARNANVAETSDPKAYRLKWLDNELTAACVQHRFAIGRPRNGIHRAICGTRRS